MSSMVEPIISPEVDWPSWYNISSFIYDKGDLEHIEISLTVTADTASSALDLAMVCLSLCIERHCYDDVYYVADA